MRRRTTTLLIVGLLLGLLVIAPTATPFRVESATSDAMAPTIESGDAYVTVPADAVSEGDIVVFWAPEEGQFLTRSVLATGEPGYVLGPEGAAAGPTDEGTENASTRDSRVVSRSAIVAKVLTVGGSPVVFPGFGGVVSTLGTVQIVGLFLALLVLAVWFVRRRVSERANGRTVTIRVRTVAVPLLLVLFVTCVAITPLSATSYRLTYDVTETNESGAANGAGVTRAVTLPAVAPPLTEWVVDGEGATVLNWTSDGNGVNATLSVPPPEEADRAEVAVHLFPYPEWVPEPLLGAAHDLHPIVANLLGAVTLVGPLALLYRVLLDGAQPIARVRQGRLYPLRRG